MRIFFKAFWVIKTKDDNDGESLNDTEGLVAGM